MSALPIASNDSAPDAAPAPETPWAVALREVTSNLALFDQVEVGLQKLEADHGGVIFDVATPKGFAAAKAARLACREPRYATQNAIAEAKHPLNRLKAAIAERGESIIKRITAVESPIDAQVKAEEDRRKAEKARLEREAAERKAAIDEAIEEIRSRVDACIGQPLDFIVTTIEWLDNTEVEEEDFGDRTAEARGAWSATRERLVIMKATLEAAELAAAAAKIEADKLKAQKDALDARERELAAREAALKPAQRTPAVDYSTNNQAEWRGPSLDQALASAQGRTLDAALLRVDPVPAVKAERVYTPLFADPEPVPAVKAEQPAQPVVTRAAEWRPTDAQVVSVLAHYYNVTEMTVVGWIREMDPVALAERFNPENDVPF